MQRFMVMIEGHGWQDFEELELPTAPSEGEPVETKYGTCLVTKVEQTPDTEGFDGRLHCRVF